MTAHTQASAEARSRQALVEESPLQVVGTINTNRVLLAKYVGYHAIYLSGGGVAMGSLGLPDLGVSGLDDALMDVRRITDVCSVPLLVDVDAGFGASTFNVACTTKSLTKFGAAAMHIGNQADVKCCDRQPNKEIVSRGETVDRIKATVDARTDANFVIMTCTDTLAVEGLNCALERAVACVETSADAIFPKATTELSMHRKFVDEVKTPVLANITEFGQTPLFTCDELTSTGVLTILYPLSVFRMVSKAAKNVYAAIRRDGTQQNAVGTMQTRTELYDRIGYHDYKAKLDVLFVQNRR